MTTEPNVYQRLAAAMQAVTYVQKERKQGMQYSIVSHDQVTAKVRPALLAQGIIYYPLRCEHTQNGNRAECSMTVRFVNIDKPDDFFDVQTFGYGVDTQDKGPGKAMSYAVKYALLKAMGLETGDDADHDQIEHDPKSGQPTQHEMIRDDMLASIKTYGAAQVAENPKFKEAIIELRKDAPELAAQVDTEIANGMEAA